RHRQDRGGEAAVRHPAGGSRAARRARAAGDGRLRAPVRRAVHAGGGAADRLTQVLTNLLSNAAKFSPKGASVDVSIAPQGGKVRVSVRDRGPGMPEE